MSEVEDKKNVEQPGAQSKADEKKSSGNGGKKKQCKVRAKQPINLRKTPKIDDNIAGSAKAGDEFIVVAQTGNWSKLNGGVFAMSAYLEPID